MDMNIDMNLILKFMDVDLDLLFEMYSNPNPNPCSVECRVQRVYSPVVPGKITVIMNRLVSIIKTLKVRGLYFEISGSSQ